MAKPDDRDDDKTPEFWATVTYKLWVRERFAHTGWSLDEFARRLKDVDRDAKATSGGLSQFIGPKDAIPEASRTSLMPAINKLFGQPPPPVCDPTDPNAVMRDAMLARWPTLTETERKVVATVFGVDLPTSDDE